MDRRFMEQTGSRLGDLPRGAWLGTFIAAAILAAITAAGAAASNEEAHLVYAGGAPKPPQLKVTAAKDKRALHVTIRPIFKNVGSRPGRIDRVAVVPARRSPDAIRVVYFDRSGIGRLEEKEIRCEFVVVLDSGIPQPTAPLEFRIHFYAPDGREIYWEGVVIENIPTRSS